MKKIFKKFLLILGVTFLFCSSISFVNAKTLVRCKILLPKLLKDSFIPKLLKERLGMCQARLDSGKTNTNSEINVLFPKTPGAVVDTQLGLDAEYVGLIDELSVSII